MNDTDNIVDYTIVFRIFDEPPNNHNLHDDALRTLCDHHPQQQSRRQDHGHHRSQLPCDSPAGGDEDLRGSSPTDRRAMTASSGLSAAESPPDNRHAPSAGSFSPRLSKEGGT